MDEPVNKWEDDPAKADNWSERSTGLLRLFPKRLGQMEAMLPEVPKYPGYRLPTTAPIAGNVMMKSPIAPPRTIRMRGVLTA